MPEVTAHLRSLHIAPRKVRLVADTLKGLKVIDATRALSFRKRRASVPLGKLMNSAIANAKQNANVTNPEETMYVKSITVDEGRPFKRYMPRAQGRATMYKKRTSHITLVLDSDEALAQ